MKLYWVKIILGALAIFALGMIIRAGINKGRDRIHSITETSEPINIPFPLGIMPFRLDGTKLGTVERVTLLRDSPKGISNIRVMVKLSDSIPPSRLKQCMMTIDDPQRINEHTTFRCQAADTAGLQLVPYGEVNVEGMDTSFPLLLTAAAVADLRSDSANTRMEADADSIANAAEAYADSMKRDGGFSHQREHGAGRLDPGGSQPAVRFHSRGHASHGGFDPAVPARNASASGPADRARRVKRMAGRLFSHALGVLRSASRTATVHIWSIPPATERVIAVTLHSPLSSVAAAQRSMSRQSWSAGSNCGGD
jgi:hypothetical protein